MKNLRTLLAVSLFACAFGAQAGSATTQNPLIITTNIATSCVVSTASNLAFGVYDPSGANIATNKDATGTINVRCTAGSTNVRVSFGQGLWPTAASTCASPQRRMKSAAGKFMNYAVYSDSARTLVRGCQANTNDQAIPASSFTTSDTQVAVVQYGRIPGGQDIPNGTYSDTVSVTVNF